MSYEKNKRTKERIYEEKTTVTIFLNHADYRRVRACDFLFFFHFVTDEGIHLIWNDEAGKPFVTLLIGIFGVLFVFASAISALSAWIFYKPTEEK
ncbi:MAG: hypothetical protein IKD15_00940 [Clostridia bacterium]|nr:hypothetical protein [Clostridia bacterium]